ncbi:MAG: hypothetical protein WBK28_02940 [Minisyncoccia bacterium]
MEHKMHNLEVNLPVAFIQEGEQVVAYTPALDISTSGKDEAEAKVRFNELVNIFFADLIENGTVDEVLSDLGWHKGQLAWTPPRISQSLYVKLGIRPVECRTHLRTAQFRGWSGCDE